MIYNPLDKFYKSEIGAVCADKNITFRVKGNFDSVVFVIEKDNSFSEKRIEMSRNGDLFECTVSFDCGLYFYYFDLNNGYFISLDDNYVGCVANYRKSFQLSVYSKDYRVPKWIYGGTIYQIFPDRFCRAGKEKTLPEYKYLHKSWGETPVYEPNEFGKILNNDFFGGDIDGIISKLEYISSLGVTAIYLNPVFKAFSNHRYDTGDYFQIDPLLGDMSDFERLIRKAEKFGIKIILDGVFNHTGDDSVYFNKYGRYNSLGAYQSKDSPYYNWYNFSEFPERYESWWGVDTLPAVNESESSFIEFITGKNGVLQFYTEKGICGWRLDVVDELPSEFVKKIRLAVKEKNNEAIVIGEVWEDASNKISYGKRREYFQGNELDSVMNYPLKNAIIDYVITGRAESISFTVKEQIDHYPSKALHALMNILSTHDTCRLLTVVGGKSPLGMTKREMENTIITGDELKTAKFRLKAASLLQFTLCGVPSIYYGDEAGMQGYVDPLNRKCFPWGKEDTEIIEWYKLLGDLRKQYSVFAEGEFVEIFAKGGAYVFKRIAEDSEILIAVNTSDKAYDIKFSGELLEIMGNKSVKEKYVLKNQSFAIFVKSV